MASLIYAAAFKISLLFGGAFIEASTLHTRAWSSMTGFPFLFGRAFIEAVPMRGLLGCFWGISLPFRRGFY